MPTVLPPIASRVRIAWERPLAPARMIRKVNRFVAHVEHAGAEEVVHIPNTGRLTELVQPGMEVRLRPGAPDSARKTRFDLLLSKRKEGWVCIEAVQANRLLRAAFEARAFGAALRYETVKPEHALGRSRFDFLLEGGPKPILVEVKAATLEESRVARFPDAPSERARRHLEELLRLRAQGYRTLVVFVALLGFADRFCPADRTDPAFGAALRRVSGEGQEIWALAAEVGPRGLGLDRALPVDFGA